ncbi:ABC transporter substrate-binding protein [Arthrobacter sp. NQ4]|uniref:ABC transporter substrate-binding protein n=1 Tax=Arthrobacter sp. NQ4 TaxID=3027930 RepID=UPI0023B00C2A|nr:ABC transporter substrate-binding protein [Arthrobacter sp. NQ4]MDE8587802.1 ABC transporter substrate-binding protein [Arthrobacter sp. NQ4]
MKKMTPILPRRAALAMALAGVMAVTACGGGGAEPASAKKITVLHAPINYEPLYIAKQKGFFDEVGLDVDIRPGGTAQDNLSQLVGGSAAISTVSWDAAVTATAEDLPIKLISGAGLISKVVDTSGVVVRKDSGITDLSGLKGKTIAFNSLGSGGNVPVLQALTDAGVNLDTVKQVALPYASMRTALSSSQVDAIFPADSFYNQVISDASFHVIANPSRQYRAGLGITLWAATDPWLQTNGETAKKFNEAMAKAVAFYNDPGNADAVYKVRSEVTGNSIENSKGPLVEQQVAVDPKVSQETTDALKKFGMASKPKSVDEILWEGAPRA